MPTPTPAALKSVYNWRQRLARTALVSFAAGTLLEGGCFGSAVAQTFRAGATSGLEAGLNSIVQGDVGTGAQSIATGVVTGLFDLFEPEAG